MVPIAPRFIPRTILWKYLEIPNCVVRTHGSRFTAR
jgi:hypothetical protein